MGEVFFYHLTQSPPEQALRKLLDKALAQGWRVVVRGKTPEFLDRLDAALWLGPEEGFLPHGRAGGPHDALQPVLLTTEATAPNRPDCLVCVETAALTAEEVAALARAVIVFEDQDRAAVEEARAQWRAFVAAGLRLQYWSQDSGNWRMARQHPQP